MDIFNYLLWLNFDLAFCDILFCNVLSLFIYLFTSLYLYVFMTVNIKVKFLWSLHEGISGGVEIQLHPFLTPPLDGGKPLPSCSGHFTPGEEPRYPLIRKFSGPQSWSERFGEKSLVPARI